MFSVLKRFRVIPIVKYKNLDEKTAVKIAEALREGGLMAMELIFRSHSDSKAIRAVTKKFPDFWIGAGGILNKDQLLRAIDASARFALSPGVNVETIREANKRNILFAPGACTPSDIENVLLNGSVDFQFFPAEQSGGVEMLKAIIEPFEHLGIEVFPKGNIGPEKIASYLEVPQVASVGVTWIAGPDLIEKKDWKKITENARKAVKIASDFDKKRN